MCLPEDKEKDRLQAIREHVRQHIQAVTGSDDTTGIEIASLIRLIGNLYEVIGNQRHGECDLSGSRWAVLLRLMAEEQRGETGGMMPTSLSRAQNVGKNTISSLIRGLEKQGLVERLSDPDDRRVFRIQLTPTGRGLVQATAPGRLNHVNQLTSCLTQEERETLIMLLGKLYQSVVANSNLSEAEIHGAGVKNHGG